MCQSDRGNDLFSSLAMERLPVMHPTNKVNKSSVKLGARVRPAAGSFSSPPRPVALRGPFCQISAWVSASNACRPPPHAPAPCPVWLCRPLPHCRTYPPPQAFFRTGHPRGETLPRDFDFRFLPAIRAPRGTVWVLPSRMEASASGKGPRGWVSPRLWDQWGGNVGSGAQTVLVQVTVP